MEASAFPTSGAAKADFPPKAEQIVEEEVITAATDAVRKDVNIQDLLEAGLHFGHQTKRWNPKMKRYIFGERNGIYIIDLAQSLDKLMEARQFIYDTVARGRKLLMVGTKKQAQEPIREAAEKLKMPYIVNRWLGGTLTNNKTIRQSVKRMRGLEKLEEDGTINDLPKKEVAKIRRELAKMQFNLSGIADMDQLPGAMFVVDVARESIAVAEANKLKIPVIAMIDTNCNPDPIDYPIPGNDDAIRAIRLIVDTISTTIQQASNEYAKVAAEEARRRAQEEAEAAARAKAAEEERKAREEEEKKARAEALEKQKAEAAKAAAAKEAEDKAKAEAKPETKPAEAKSAEKKADKSAEKAAEKPAEPKAEPKTEPKAEAKAEAAKAEPAAEKKVEAKAETKTEEKPAAKAEPKAEAKPAEKPAEPKAEKKAEPKAAEKPAPKADEKKVDKPAEPKAAEKAEPKAEAKTEAKPEAKSAEKPAEPKADDKAEQAKKK